MLCFLFFKSQMRLRDRKDSPQLLMDAKHIFPVTFPFNPSSLALETIQIPASLGLGFISRVWKWWDVKANSGNKNPLFPGSDWKDIFKEAVLIIFQTRGY